MNSENYRKTKLGLNKRRDEEATLRWILNGSRRKIKLDGY